jgi:peroxiredoxin family protein
MSDLRGLTIVVVSADAERWGAALLIASAAAALGGAVRVYAHDAAVTGLVASEALDTARQLGVRFIACQGGLDTHGLALPDFAEAGGLVSLLATLGDDRLVTV